MEYLQEKGLFLEPEIKMGEVPSRMNEALRESSCKSAIKFNDQLNRAQAESVLEDLKLTDNPCYCIHGRATIHPIFVSFEEEEE